MQNVKRLAAFTSLSLLAVALMAAPAFATGTTPTWQNPGKTKWTGTLTLKKNGGSAVTCTVSRTGDSTNESGTGWADYDVLAAYPWSLPCSGGTSLSWELFQEANYNTTSHVFSLNMLVGFCGIAASPWGEWCPYYEGTKSTLAPYTNGSGTTASKVTLNETPIGTEVGGEVITATGTLSVLNGSTNTAEILTLK